MTIKLAVLHPPGTNVHEAGKLFCRREPRLAQAEPLFAHNNEEILRLVSAGEAEFGVVPIENGLGGLVSEVVKFWLSETHLANDSLSSLNGLRVIGEITLPIKHGLLVHPSVNGLEEIERVISHDQALKQCARTLDQLGLGIREAVSSTAQAAQLIASDDRHRRSAAIASAFAAETYGLKVLETELADHPSNTTRFHLIGHISTKPTGRDKTAVMFLLVDKPGSLYRALGTIHSLGANMSSIHSIPLGPLGKFAFYIEFEGHHQESQVKATLRLLQNASEGLLVLGSFPIA